MKKFLNVFFVALFLSLFFTNDVRASHAMGADLEYTCLGNNQYSVSLKFYRDCSGISAPSNPVLTILNTCTGASFNANLTLRTNAPCPNGGFSGTTGCEVSPLCSSQIGTSSCNSSPGSYPGVQVYEYTGTFTLTSACAKWLLRFSESARNTNNNLATSGDLAIEGMINNTINPATGLPYCNNSARFSEVPVPFKCLNQPTTYNHGAVEPDGDSLRYFLTNPLGNGYAPITNYSAGYSVSQPVKTTPANSFVFDQNSGQMIFTPAQIETDVLAVRVEEYRKGVLIGYTMRDVQVKVITCNVSIPAFATNIDSLTNGIKLDSTTFRTCPGTPISFSVLGIDRNNKTLTITSTLQTGVNSPLPGASFTTQNVGTAPFDSVRAKITWTPAATDTGCRSFLITLKNNDCPVSGTNVRVFKACIFNGVIVTPKTAIYCGTPIQLTTTGGFNYSWTPPAGLDNPLSYTPLASPSVTTTYKFTSDCGTDSAVITVTPPFAISAGPGGQICRNGQLQLNATLASTYAPYQVVWLPSTGLLDPITGLPTTTGLNPVASPTSTTQYTLQVTGSNGCVRTDTVSVRVAGVAPSIIASANPTSICPGTQVQLKIVANPANCGIPLAPCTGNIRNVDIGTATTIQGGGGTLYPSLYGNNKKSARHQVLIKASELIAALGSGGQINSLTTFLGSTINSNSTLQNFTVSMACTQLDSLTSFVGGLTQVVNPKNHTPVPGGNTHIFDQPYDWDGVSDLVVDFCFSGTSSGAINNKDVYTTTPYRSFWFSADNTSTACGVTGVYTVTSYAFYFNRPNIQFNICQPSLDNANIAWTPATGPNAPTPLNNDTVYATPVSPTRYVASVTNSGGCVGNDFVFVNVDTSLRLVVTPDTFICSINPIRLNANMSGSPLPGNQFTYTWTASVGAAPPSGTGPSFATALMNPTQPTTYICVVTGGACVKRDTAVVVIGNGLPVSIRLDSIKCNGAANGKAFALKQGGVSPFTYAWNPSLSTTDSLVGLSPGTYSVTVTDNVGCSGSATAILTQPAALTLVMDSINIRCNGLANGQVSATVGGGIQPYTYTWSPAAPNSPTLTNLSPGLYLLTVTDRNGCTISGRRNVRQPTPLTTTTQAFAVSVNGGSDGKAKVTAGGGVAPYTYTWSGGGNTDSITNKPKGTYYVTVCDANNCCKTDSAKITDPPPIILSFVTTNNLCFGDSAGTASVSAVGGVLPYTFTWSTTNVGTSISGLKAGIYTVTVADSNNVTVQGSVTITQPTPVTITFDSVSILCFGGNNGSLTANATGGTGAYSYQWSNGAGNVMNTTGLVANTYTVTVTDANGCSASATKRLFQPPLLDATLVSTDSTSCFGTSDGSATVAVVGGTPNYTYTWSVASAPNAPSASVFPAGPQGVLVTDQNGCQDTVNFIIKQPVQIQLSVATIKASCATSNNGRATATVGGGTAPYVYRWDAQIGTNPNTTLAAGNHVLLVTDDNGCFVNNSFVIDTQYVLHLAIATVDAKCNGAADGRATVTTLNGTAGYTYQWTPAGSTPSITSGAANVSVLVTDNVNCTATISGVINEPSPIVLTTGNIPPSCNGRTDGKAWVGATGGTPGYSYVWSNLATTDTIRNIQAGNYPVTATDNNGCTATTTQDVFNPASLTASFDKIEITCFDAADGSGGVVAAGGTQPYSFVWSDNFTGGLRNNIAPGTYEITVTDKNKCDTVLTVEYDAPPGIQFLEINLDSISCPRATDGQILIDVSGGTPGLAVPYTYSLDGVNFQSNRLFDNLAAGPHRVWVRDGNNCTKDTLVYIESPQELVFAIEPQDSTIGLGKSLQLGIITNSFPTSNINGYAWSTGDGLSCADCPNPVASPYNNTTYTLSVYYGENCLAKNTVTVNVGNEPDYYMPNAFSPNGDGKNDEIRLFGGSLKTVELTIFNRWGEIVFKTSNQFQAWDGTYKGQQLGPGLYTYLADLEYLNGKKKRDFGTITLIR